MMTITYYLTMLMNLAQTPDGINIVIALICGGALLGASGRLVFFATFCLHLLPVLM